jgi:DNA polymerase-1
MSAAYIDTTKRSCREKGYVTTLFGRVCHYPQIRSNNPSERASVVDVVANAGKPLEILLDEG